VLKQLNAQKAFPKTEWRASIHLGPSSIHKTSGWTLCWRKVLGLDTAGTSGTIHNSPIPSSAIPFTVQQLLISRSSIQDHTLPQPSNHPARPSKKHSSIPESSNQGSAPPYLPPMAANRNLVFHLQLTYNIQSFSFIYEHATHHATYDPELPQGGWEVRREGWLWIGML
jgi:hypothetical protein